MKLLLVYANRNEYLLPPPVGLMLLTAPLRADGHEVAVVDLMAERHPDAVLAEALERHKPDLVGLSLRNLDNQDFKAPQSPLDDYARWVALAGEHAPTIVGGSALTTLPERLYERVGATYALAGQGDRAFPHFVRELAAGATSFTAPGLLWRDNGKLRRNPAVLEGYAKGGSLDWSAIDYRRYRKGYVSCGVITKTGCPHQCLFCDTRVSFGGEFVAREPEAIVEDLRRGIPGYAYNKFDFFFIDAMFGEPAEWTKRVLEAITRAGLRIGFSAIIEPTAAVDREIARLFRRAGGTMATGLVGSLDAGMIERMRRPFTRDDVHRALEIFDEERLPYMPQFLFGGPGETRESVQATIDGLSRHHPLMVQAAYGIRIMPQAGLRAVALEEGVIDESADLLEPTFYLSAALRSEREWLDRKVRELTRFRLSSVPQWAALFARTAWRQLPWRAKAPGAPERA
ncbi:MAG: cobalamin B12-binding domain-containing protein [Deltaproteobacteria bacterium]|nr:cobalamin B12-binding domain-containing protein [Deltaproteobacteria bacterium]